MKKNSNYNSLFIEQSMSLGIRNYQTFINHYERCFLRVKAQHTILENFKNKLDLMNSNLCWDDKQTFTFIKYLIESLENVPYYLLFDSAKNTIDSVLHFNAPFSNALENDKILILNSLMNSTIVIGKIVTELCATYQKGKFDEDLQSKKLYNDECQYQDNDKTLICRICDMVVPVSLFEEHTKMCLEKFQAESKVVKVNDKLKEMKNKIGKCYLNVSWPGEQNEAVSKIIPILHVFLLISRAIDIDLSISDSTDELSFIHGVFVSLQKSNVELLIDNNIREEISNLILEKIKLCNVMNNASYVLRQTRINGLKSRKTHLTIADFDFIKKISRGAFAIVFLAQKKSTKDIYAIKVTPKSELKQKNQLRRVLIEKDILLQFNNPFIVRFYYSIIGENNLYLVTEFVPGGDLYSLLEKVGALDEHSAKIYALQVVYALKYLRQNGIIHRDIKPDNILVSADGHLKLTDFGVSYMGMFDRNKNTEDNINQASSIVGTPDYISPEIILNQTHTYTTDYWSLGIMIYEFLTGSPPFHGEDETETRKNILIGKIQYYDDVEISPEGKDIIRRLLCFNPKERLGYKSIDEIINHKWFEGIDPLKEPPPFIPQLESQFDVGYFEQRYKMDINQDISIIDDLQKYIQPSSFAIDDDMLSFPCVAVEQLSNANKEAQEKFMQDHPSNQKSFTENQPTNKISPNITRRCRDVKTYGHGSSSSLSISESQKGTKKIK